MKTLLQLKIELIKSIINYPFLYRSSIDWILGILTMDEKYNNMGVVDHWAVQGISNDRTVIYSLVSCHYIPEDVSEVLLDYEERR